MTSPLFITERWLADHARLVPGGELRLPAESRLTPSVRDLLQARRIRVRFADAEGRIFVEPAADEGGDEPERRRVHPLTGESGHSAAHCPLCRQAVAHKGEALTHLDAQTYVAKNDPRIVLRGRVDSAIADAVLIQTQWQAEGVASAFQTMLADVRAGLGNVLRAEALGEPALPVSMGEFSQEQVHAVSHQPLKYLGHDHIVPAIEHGLQVARLNVLRAAIREAELAGAAAYIDRDFKVTRADLLQALNRLSSAVYVLMLLVLVAERGTRATGSGGAA